MILEVVLVLVIGSRMRMLKVRDQGGGEGGKVTVAHGYRRVRNVLALGRLKRLPSERPAHLAVAHLRNLLLASTPPSSVSSALFAALPGGPAPPQWLLLELPPV